MTRNLSINTFIKNLIFKEEDIVSISTFENSQGGIQLTTKKFNLIILHNQIVLSGNNPKDADSEISEVATLIIKNSNSNITALGINFYWNISDPGLTLSVLSKQIFYSENIALFNNFFNTDDATFGVYASASFRDGRLKLDVKPGIASILQDKTVIQKEMITFSFNFHFDIKNKSENVEIISFLSDYDFYQQESVRIISFYK